MKRINYILFPLVILFLNISVLEAKCTNNDIVNNANSIKTKLEATPSTADQEDRNYVIVENIPDNYYLIVVNNTMNTKDTYMDFKNNTVAFSPPNVNYVYNYSIKIYSSDTECENELIKTINVNSLAYNPYSVSPECMMLEKEDKENNFEGCKYFVDKLYTHDSFLSELEKYKSGTPEATINTLKDLFYKYYYFALIPIAVLGVYYVVRLQIIKRRKNKDEK